MIIQNYQTLKFIHIYKIKFKPLLEKAQINL